MAKNRIRFRKDLSDFLAQHCAERQCADALFGGRWPAGFMCAQCGHAEGFVALRTREPMQVLPPPDLVDCRDDLRLHQTAPDRPVSRHVSAHATGKLHRRPRA
jgi:hypothetical protein